MTGRLRRAAVFFVAWAVVVVGVIAYRLVAERPEPSAAGPATLPSAFAGHSMVLGSEADSPVGRAIALYHQTTGSDMFDFGQEVLAGADANRYREISLPSGVDSGQPLLRPDGLAVALISLGVRYPSPSVVFLLDLTTGQWRTLPTSGYADAPLAWSADGRYLAYDTGASAPSDDTRTAILDTATGTNTRTTWPKLAPGAPDITVAFAPDNTHLAVQNARALRILGVDGLPQRELTLPDGYSLAPDTAWSPDGRLIATFQAGAGFVLLDAGTGAPARTISMPRATHLLGWRSADEMIVSVDEFGHAADSLIELVSVATGVTTPVTRFDIDPTASYPVQELTFARGLLGDIAVRPAGGPNRGPWPLTPTILALLAWTALIATLVCLRTRAPVAPPVARADAPPSATTSRKSWLRTRS